MANSLVALLNLGQLSGKFENIGGVTPPPSAGRWKIPLVQSGVELCVHRVIGPRSMNFIFHYSPETITNLRPGGTSSNK